MAVNFPGPYQLVIHYTVTASPGSAQNHVLALNVVCETDPDVGDLFSAIYITSRGGSQGILSSVTDALVALLDDLFSDTTTVFNYAELFKFTAGTFVSTWISSYTLGDAGVGVSAPHPAAQHTYQFRTTEGGIMKIVLMDPMSGPAEPFYYGDLAAAPKALVDYVLASSTGFFLGRDTSYPIAFINLLNGVNEKLFRARYRP